MAKDCIFCGNSPTSREHVFPEWVVAELMKDPRGLPRWTLYTQRSGEHRWNTNKPLDIVVRTVCKRCNETWMSDIEKAAQPHLIPMFAGAKTLLDKDAMTAISKWMTLRALIAVSDAPKEESTDQPFHLFYRRKVPMPRWHVFVSSYEGTIPVHMDVNRLTYLPFRVLGIPVNAYGPTILVNCVIGRVIFKVILFAYPPLLRIPLFNLLAIPPWDISVVRIFPPRRKQVTWPTDTVITDDTILESYQAGLTQPSLPTPFLGKYQEQHRNEIDPPYGDHH